MKPAAPNTNREEPTNGQRRTAKQSREEEAEAGKAQACSSYVDVLCGKIGEEADDRREEVEPGGRTVIQRQIALRLKDAQDAEVKHK